MALRCGMEAIGLVQFGHAGYALEQERDQSASVYAGELGKTDENAEAYT